MEKQTKKVIPCGYLYDNNGHDYYLLSPHPVDFDTWVTDLRQAWQAVKMGYDFETEDDLRCPVGGQVTVICSKLATIELTTVEPIEIEVYDWVGEELKNEMGALELDSAIDLAKVYAEYQEEPLPF